MKVWVYQNLLLAMIRWSLMICKIPLSWVEYVEAYLNGYLCKWLGVSKNISNVSLYCDERPCLLPIHGLVTEFKNGKVGRLLQLQQSDDQLVRDNIPELYTGRKWKVAVTASIIDHRIKRSKVMGNTQIGRTGLGYIKRRNWVNDERQQSYQEFLEVIRKAESESLYTKAVQQSVQAITKKNNWCLTNINWCLTNISQF